MVRLRVKPLVFLGLFLTLFLGFTLQAQAYICRNNETGVEYNTIQEALNVAGARNHIIVYSGTYSGAGNTALNWPAVQDISLVGNSIAPCPISVFIDALATTRHIVSNYDVRFKLSNIAFLNGRASIADSGDNKGGSIYTSGDNPSLVLSIDNCVISGNAAYSGGAIYSGNQSVVSMNNSMLQGNYAAFGGAFFSGTNRLKNTTLNMNTATENGGVFYKGTNRLLNCLVINATSTQGGVFFDGSNELVNCTLAKNSPEIYYDSSPLAGVDGQLDASNTIFSGTFNSGTPANFSSCTLNICAFTDAVLTGDMITKLPFLSFDNSGFSDYANDDFTLLAGCPVINLGLNAYWQSNSENISTDLAGNSRIKAGSIDMGAYESATATTQNCLIFETGQLCQTIQYALVNASSGNHIYVYPGTHKGVGNVGLVWPNVENITLMAYPGLGTSVNVILDAESVTRNIYQENAVTWTLSDLSLINGQVSQFNTGDNKGGAIYINVNNSQHNLILASCRLSNSKAYSGGAVYSGLSSCSLTSGSMLINNRANSYGGVFFDGTNVVRNSIFRNNSASLEGGVFYFGTNTLTGSLLDANQADFGGVFRNGNNRLISCSLLNNTEATKGTVFGEGVNTLYNCIVSNNISFDQAAVFYMGKNLLINCLVVSNNAANNGGVFYEGDNTLLNCTLVKNSPEIYYDNDSRSDIYGAMNAYNTIFGGTFNGGNDLYFDSCVLSYCTLTDNILPSGIVSSNLISSFNSSEFADYSHNDFRLTTGSVAVNTGSNSLWTLHSDSVTCDVSGLPRLIDNIDLGAQELQLYLTTPNVPAITPISSPTNSVIIQVSGTRSVNAVSINLTCQTAASVGPVVYTDATSWSVTLNGLAEGLNDITVNALNSLGITSNYVTASVFIDTIKPLNPTFDSLDIATSNSSLTLSGSRSTDSILIEAMLPTACSQTEMTYPSENRWEFSLSSLVEGNNVITLNARDSAGNASDYVTLNILLDSQAPVAPTIATLNNVVTYSSLVITGSCSTDSVAVVVMCSTAVTISAVEYPASGNWQTTVNGLAQGTNNILAYAMDALGNASISTSLSVYVDSLAPVTPSIATALLPTSSRTFLLKGGISPDTLTFNLECSSAAIFTQPQMLTATAWQVTFNGLVLGSNLITLNALDGLGSRSFVTASINIQPTVNISPTMSLTLAFVSDPVTDQGWSTASAVIKRDLGNNTTAKIMLSAATLGIDFSEDYSGIHITTNALGIPVISVPTATGTFGNFINNQSGAVSVPLIFKLKNTSHPLLTVDIGQGFRTITRWDGSEKSGIGAVYQNRISSYNVNSATLNFSVSKFSSYSAAVLSTIDVKVSANTLIPLDTTTLNIRLLDTNGEGIEGAPVSLNITAGGGTLSATQSTSDADGYLTLYFQAGQTPTKSYLSINCDGVSNTSVSINTVAIPLNGPYITSSLAPTQATTLRVSGVKSSYDVTVNVSCPAAASIDIVSYPSSTSWTTTLNNLVQGANTLTIFGVNYLGGNSSTTTSTLIIDFTTPSINRVNVDGINLAANSSVADQPLLTLITTDNVGVSSVNIYIDSVLYTTVAVSGTLCNSEIQIQPALNPGVHTLTLDLFDQAHNMTQRVFSLNVSATLGMIGPVLNYPNPFNPQTGTTIYYWLTKGADITLHVTDILGHKVAEKQFYNGSTGGKAGKNVVNWNFRDLWGNPITSGYYLLQVFGGGKLLGKCKMVAAK